MRTALLLAALAPAAAADDEVTADLAWRSGGRLNYDVADMHLSPVPPPKLAPPVGAKEPHYARPLLARRPVPIAVDATPALWIDLDGDGELADEKPVAFQKLEGRIEATVELVLEPGVRVRVLLFRRTEEPPSTLHVVPLAHREGTVVLAGRLRRIAVYDGTGRLAFDDEVRDAWFVDLDGDGRLDRGPESAERVRPGRPFRLEGKGCVVRALDPAAGRVAFRGVGEAPPPPPPRWEAEEPEPPGRRAPGDDLSLKELRRLFERSKKLERKRGVVFDVIGRTARLGEIGALGTVPAYRFLLKAYRSEKEAEVKAAAVAAMGYLEYQPYAKEVFRIAARAKAPEVVAAAAKALHGMDAPGRAEVYRTLLAEAADDAVVAAAADGLAATRDPDRFTFLLELAATRPRCAFHAYRAGTRFRAVPPPSFAVRAAAGAKDPRLRALALRDATRLGLPEAVDLAHHAAQAARYDEGLRLAVIERLGAVGRPDDVRVLLRLAVGASPAARGRLTDLLRLVRDRSSIALLVGALEAESVVTRRVAADVLARIEGEEVAVAIAARIAREEDPDTLAALVRAAGWHRSAAAAAAIVDAARRKAGAAELTDAAVEALARIGLGLEAVRTYFSGLATSLEWQERVTALDAIAADRHPAAIDLMVKGLADPVWQVRLAAIQGLARSRARAAIGPLVARLDPAEPTRIRRAAGLALFQITGQQFFDSHELWTKWWRDHEKTFQVPPEPPRPTASAGRTVATFYGIPVDSDRVIFVIDQSGSMGGDRAFGRRRKGPSELKRAVEETLKVIERLPHDAKANVILFESTVQAWRKELVALKPGRRQALARFLRAKRARGGTNLFDALEMALGTAEVDTIYVLSDGEPTAGRLTRDEDILREIRRLNRVRRIAIHTVALGHESTLLADLAAENAGTHTQR